MKIVETEEFEARYLDLLREVKAGETVQIAEHGMVVAEVKAVPQKQDTESVLRDILERRKGRPVVTQAEGAQWKHEGHRY